MTFLTLLRINCAEIHLVVKHTDGIDYLPGNYLMHEGQNELCGFHLLRKDICGDGFRVLYIAILGHLTHNEH